MEQRAYPRYSVRLNALITIGGLTRQPCTIRDFCLGGMFLALRPGARGQGTRGTPMLIEFAITDDGPLTEFKLQAHVARVLDSGLGVAFSNPEPTALVALQRLADQIQQTETHPLSDAAAAAEADREARAAGGVDRPAIKTACINLVRDRLPAMMSLFLRESDEGLLNAAREAPSNVEQTRCFDALTALDKVKGKVESDFVQLVTAQMERVLRSRGTATAAPAQEAARGRSTLALIDKDEFEEFLTLSELTSRAENRLQDRVKELDQRFCRLIRARIAEGKTPAGPAAITEAFGQAMKNLSVDRRPLDTIYKAFEATVVKGLDGLYDALNSLLAERGIEPLEEDLTHAVPQRAPAASHATPTSAQRRPGVPPQGPVPQPEAHGSGGLAQDPGPAAAPGPYGPAQPPAYPGAAASAAIPAGGYGGAARGGEVPGAYGGPGQAASFSPAESLAGGGGWPAPSQVAQGTGSGEGGVWPGAAAGSPGGIPGGLGQAYRTAQTLLGLQRYGSGARTGAPSLPDAFPAYPESEVLAALSDLQREELKAPDSSLLHQGLRERLQRALTKRGSGPGRLGARENDAITVLSDLFRSILEDVLVSEPTKQRVLRLRTPVHKAALLDEAFFQEDDHPARRFLTHIAGLESEVGVADEGERQAMWASVDPLIKRVAAEFDQDVGVFANAVEELDDLVRTRTGTYDGNVQEVVKACEAQEAFLKARRKSGDQTGEHKLRHGTPESGEWAEWLNRTKRLHVGDVVVLDHGTDKPKRTTLAWIGEDNSPYVFVDGSGKKAASLTLQELSMQLRRGAAKVLHASELSVVDRAAYSMLQKMHDRLERQASHDPLTGLMNRRSFEDRLSRAVKRAIHEHVEHALLNIDLDRFRIVVDSCGRDASEALLRQVGERIQTKLDGKGTLARLGGDVFGLLLEDCTRDEAVKLAEEVREAVRASEFSWGEASFPVSASIALVPVTRESGSAEVVLKAAASTCQAAKDEGGNRSKVYDAGDAGVARRRGMVEWVTQLNKTLSQDRVLLRCQRISPVTAGGAVKPHYEILLGLRDEKGEPIPPAEFIEAAEYYEQMLTLDRWVVRNALHWMAEHRQKLREVGGFAINLSGYSLSDDGLTAFVMEQLTHTKVPPGKVMFEVTETAAVARLSNAESFIRTLKEFGCRFSLDDFGSGHSSYSYLKNLPVDYVKIDGQFVRDIVVNTDDEAVVRSVNEIAHLMGKKTIAEYVESQEILDKIRDIGVDYAQGYWVGQPVYLDEIGSEPVGAPPPPAPRPKAPPVAPSQDTDEGDLDSTLKL